MVELWLMLYAQLNWEVLEMNFRDFKIGWRLLIKEPSYSAIVILGLSIGFAVCFLLLGLVRYQTNFDTM